ncbi:hypothetical protein [uncultured Pseudomonas sp.]|uniref:hypothetical protein n=1 Tax=Pseudomonas sp. 22072 TaxID=3453865 RepID=UPI0028D6809C|nr:hypothetical protein [uncultured Pseudomonas sp.]
MSELFERWLKAHHEASDKMNYFMLGAILAICAYFAQTNTYAKLGLNQQTFLIGTLLIFGLSAFFGFRRIESGLHVVKHNGDYIQCLELKDKEGARACFQLMNEASVKTGVFYRWRNYTLVLGFVCFLVTKVAGQYLI